MHKQYFFELITEKEQFDSLNPLNTSIEHLVETDSWNKLSLTFFYDQFFNLLKEGCKYKNKIYYTIHVLCLVKQTHKVCENLS